MEKIAKNISIKGLCAPELSCYRQFYNTYPQILGSITQKSQKGIKVDDLFRQGNGMGNLVSNVLYNEVLESLIKKIDL